VNFNEHVLRFEYYYYGFYKLGVIEIEIVSVILGQNVYIKCVSPANTMKKKKSLLSYFRGSMHWNTAEPLASSSQSGVVSVVTFLASISLN
jgi:hypothetical protein